MHKQLTHYKTRLCTPYKKGKSKYYCFTINKDGKMDGWIQKKVLIQIMHDENKLYTGYKKVVWNINDLLWNNKIVNFEVK